MALQVWLLELHLFSHDEFVLFPDLLYNIDIFVPLIDFCKLWQNLTIDVVVLDILWVLNDVLLDYSLEEVSQLESFELLLPEIVVCFLLELIELFLNRYDLILQSIEEVICHLALVVTYFFLKAYLFLN